MMKTKRKEIFQKKKKEKKKEKKLTRTTRNSIGKMTLRTD